MAHWQSRLNPCSNGMGIEHGDGLLVSSTSQQVLILVLMEWGLSMLQPLRCWAQLVVLILVLMEWGLSNLLFNQLRKSFLSSTFLTTLLLNLLRLSVRFFANGLSFWWQTSDFSLLSCWLIVDNQYTYSLQKFRKWFAARSTQSSLAKIDLSTMGFHGDKSTHFSQMSQAFQAFFGFAK